MITREVISGCTFMKDGNAGHGELVSTEYDEGMNGTKSKLKLDNGTITRKSPFSFFFFL